MKKIIVIFIAMLIYIPICHANDDYEGSYKYYLAEAQKGDANAMFFLGSLFQAGDGVKLDLEEAKKWYTMAAKHGNIDAMWALNTIDGDTVSKIEKCAWCIIAAEQNLLPAKGRVSRCSNKKYLTETQQKEAKELAEKYKTEIKQKGYNYSSSL